MRCLRCPGVLLALAALALAAEKKIPTRVTSNELVELTANAVLDREGIRQLLGSDLDGHYIVLEIHLTPQDGKTLAIHRDDFVLRTDKDGERSRPFAPSQIAGRGALVVSQSGGGGPAFGSDGNGPIIGGGPVGTGRPRRLGGDGGAVGGSASEASAKISSGTRDKPNPVLEVLKQKELPEKESQAPASGLLYFPMEKQKLKDLELIYTTQEGKLNVRFR